MLDDRIHRRPPVTVLNSRTSVRPMRPFGRPAPAARHRSVVRGQPPCQCTPMQSPDGSAALSRECYATSIIRPPALQRHSAHGGQSNAPAGGVPLAVSPQRRDRARRGAASSVSRPCARCGLRKVRQRNVVRWREPAASLVPAGLRARRTEQRSSGRHFAPAAHSSGDAKTDQLRTIFAWRLGIVLTRRILRPSGPRAAAKGGVLCKHDEDA